MSVAMSKAEMLGPFFKEYADLGHWFDSAHGKCLRCGAETIDLYEDGAYGDVRACASADTHPKDGDVKQAPLVSGATAKPGRTEDVTPPQANNQ